MGRILLSALLLVGPVFGQGTPGGHSGEEVTFPNQLPNLLELEPLIARRAGATDLVVRRPGDDGKVVERGARREWVVLDGKGPGMLVRIQSARRVGRLRIYLDGAARPFLDEDLDALLSGRVGWALAPFASAPAGIGEMAFAIPYAKAVLVTVDHPDAEVVLTNRRFPETTTVRTVTDAERKEYQPETERLTRMMLDHRRFFLPMMQDFGKETHEFPPGKETVFFEGKTDVGEAISWLSFECPDFTPALLRRCVLVARFDGVKTVEVPLGDFHGAWEPGVTFQSTAVGTDERGLLCSRWVMPYGKSATLSLRNTLEKPVTLEIGVGRLRREFRDDTQHFHATWSRWGTSRKRTVGTIVQLRGPGTLAGVMLLWHMPTRWGFSAPRWTFHPAGSAPVTLPLAHVLGIADTATPFAEQLRGTPGNERKGMIGQTLAYRWWTLDAMPFAEDATLAIDARVPELGASLSLVASWYGKAHAVPPLPAAALVVNEPLRPAPLRVIEGAIEAESLVEVARKGMPPTVQAVRGASGDEVLRWVASAGETLTLRFDVERAGRQQLEVFARTDPGGGRFTLWVDGKSVGVLDTAADGPEVSANATVALDAGPHRLELRSDGAAAAVLGLDALRLTTE